MKLVIIDWIDSGTDFAGWQTVEQAATLHPSECQTVGFVLADDEYKITLSMSHNVQTVCGLFTIPKSCITNTRVLKDTPDEIK